MPGIGRSSGLSLLWSKPTGPMSALPPSRSSSPCDDAAPLAPEPFTICRSPAKEVGAWLCCCSCSCTHS